MKIVIAPDSFKESLTALEVAEQIAAAFAQHLPDAEFVKVPVADGGEGTVQSMVDATGGHIIHKSVTGPMGTPVNAHYGILGADSPFGDNTAVIEMAAASGLHYVPASSRNPLISSTYGTGELICDALDRGIRQIILGLGGSATNDGGAGMIQALGLRLLDDEGNALPVGGAALAKLQQIDASNAHPALSQCQFDVACDVDNPLCGERGASAIFGPQKGATAAMVTQLDAALAHFADIALSQGYRDARLTAGAGAAGGMGFGVMTFLNGKLRPGVDIVMQAVGLAEKISGADLVITGEGRIDGQTVFGKTPMGVLRVAKQQQVPVIGIAGCLGDGAEQMLAQGMTAIFDIIPAASDLSLALANAKPNLYRAASNIAAVWCLGKRQ
ncbi:glycerate kinase [Shewanella avicenniae]|uniref:Glycerate kinase n=1 Tax=Shewanella avicenniae TaxID=2814294 RepID=A0ABX7QUD6_9GAMM|nr:glycerate kinase [Shewanella avicenniae]QSX34879.1 glycerate kinase [Shewanella avicenniae]